MKKRALISVSDKTGAVEFARELVNLGYEIVSTGGTYRTIKEAGVAATYVTEITGFPEILDGRVKTLHPKVHGGILAKGTPEHMAQLEREGILPIDIVAVNLYPFAKVMAKPEFTLEEAVENIDIGGPAMVRASAKNFERVAVIVNPQHYSRVLDELKAGGQVSRELRLQLAAEAYTHTALYDRMISSYFQSLVGDSTFTSVYSLAGEKVQDLRYGENPHQRAAFYRMVGEGPGSLAYAEQLQGKELSYNNLVDMNAAWALIQEFNQPAAVIVKHTNPCGVAIADSLVSAYLKAYNADPVSAFGGIAASNREIDADTAREMVKLFLEVIIAPAFSAGALEVFAAKQNLRLMAVGEKSQGKQGLEVKQIEGGFLVQDLDVVAEDPSIWKVVSKAQPSAEDLAELAFAMKVCKHVKSNAIVVTKDNTSLGVGAGQMNRVGSAGIALEQAGEKATGAYLASDAFFFRDTLDAAAKAGIKAIVQPGGSMKDEESILAADEHGLIMLFTGVRHFKH